MSFQDNIRRAAIGGLVGGVAFGVMMGMMGVLPMIGSMIGLPNAAAGFGVHMMMSAGIGAGFALVAGAFAGHSSATVFAAASYGAAWWVLGPLTFMPWVMGMGFAANLNAAGAAAALPSLLGHLVFGVLLGITYDRLGRTEDATAIAA